MRPAAPTPPATSTAAADLSALRSRRVQLRRALHEVEEALAAPATGRSAEWAHGAHAAFADAADQFQAHVAVTEGPEGIHQTILAGDLRLANAVAGLVREHEVIAADIDGLVADTAAPDEVGPDQVVELRERATSLLTLLARHRQRGADLIYEAYQTDIGGGD
jgi:hypothetical protein